MTSNFLKLLHETTLCQEELSHKLKEHVLALLRNDKEKANKARDEALTAFYAVVSANEALAIKIAKEV